MTDTAIHSLPTDLPLEQVEAEITELSATSRQPPRRGGARRDRPVATERGDVGRLALVIDAEGQRPIGISPSTSPANAVVSAVTSPRRSPRSARENPRSARGCPKADIPRW